MKSKLSILLTSALIAMSLSSTTALAIESDTEFDHKKRKNFSHQMQKSERFKQHKFKKIARYLKLTDEQRQQAKAIHQQAKEKRLLLKEILEDFHQQSKVLIMEDNFNEQAFLNLQNQYQDTFAQMALIKANTKHSFMKLLTAEQKEKMKAHKGFKAGRRAFTE